MRLALPVREGAFCPHFGHAQGFLLCEVDDVTAQLERPRIVIRPKEGCESVPDWLKQMAVTTVVAGGIGAVARQHFADLGIKVSAGHAGSDAQQVVRAFVADPQARRKNPCSPQAHRQRHCRK